MARAGRIANLSGPATYQDVLNAPPHMVAEVVAGTLHTQPRPAKRHAWASSGLGMKIGRHSTMAMAAPRPGDP